MRVKLYMDKSSQDLFAKKQGVRAYDAVTWEFECEVDEIRPHPRHYTGYKLLIIKEPRLRTVVESLVMGLERALSVVPASHRHQHQDVAIPDSVMLWPAISVKEL